MYTLYVFPSQESSKMLRIKRGTVKTDDCQGAVARIFVLALSLFSFPVPLQLPPSLNSIPCVCVCVLRLKALQRPYTALAAVCNHK